MLGCKCCEALKSERDYLRRLVNDLIKKVGIYPEGLDEPSSPAAPINQNEKIQVEKPESSDRQFSYGEG